MRKEDETIWAYRASKDEKNGPYVEQERTDGTYQSGSVAVTDGTVPFMIYRPKKADPKAALPAVFSFHGGGFVLGYYELDGPICQRIADACGCAVINVDYLLAPEHKFPVPVTSSYEAVAAILKQADALKLNPEHPAVMGHSAGGAIAAALCLLDRDREQIGFSCQILDYAPLKQSLSEEDRQALDPDRAISRNRMVQYIQWYFSDLDDMTDPLASPVLADLSGLPPALIISAEYDSLRQEEKEFALKASEAGTKVEYICYSGCEHGFTHENLKEYNPRQADDALRRMGQFLKEHTAG